MESSNLIQTVALKRVKCYAYHGFYQEENCIGQYYEVDVEVQFKPSDDYLNLDASINYEVLNRIIKSHMEVPEKLLETLVYKILQQITSQFPFVLTAEVGIHKLRPPMEGEVGESYVSLRYQR